MRRCTLFLVGVLALAACNDKDRERSNSAPSVEVLAPASPIEVALGAVVPVDYVDEDEDRDARTTIYADRDGDLGTAGDQIVIASGRPEGGGAAQTVDWSTAGTAPGTYRILARTSDGESSDTAEAAGAVTVNAPPSVSFETQASDEAVSKGNEIVVRYTDDDPDDAAFTTVYLDQDGDIATTGDQYVLVRDRPEADGVTQELTLDSTVLPEADWHVVARVFDGINPPVLVTAAGMISVVPNVAFALGLGSTSFDTVRDVTTFADGSSVVVGVIGATATFGAGETNETTLTPNGFDPFIARYAADASLLWARLISGTGSNDDVSDVDGFADGSFAVCGLVHGTTTFGPGVTHTSAGEYDVFVAKYSADGDLVWARGSPGAGDDWARGVVAHADGTVSACGYIGGTVTFGSGESNETALLSAGSKDAWLARHDADGDLDFAIRFGASEHDEIRAIAGYSDGSVAISGFFGSTVTLGAGEANETVLTSAGGSDILTARFGADGQLAWARRAGGAGNDSGDGVAVAPDGDVLACGDFLGPATFGPGEAGETAVPGRTAASLFVARLASDGDLEWVRDAGGSGQTWANSIAVFADGSSVVTGGYTGNSVFGAGEARETTLPAGSDRVIHFARFDANGELRWARHVEGSGIYDHGNSVETFADGSCLVGGRFAGPTVVFGLGQPNETTLTNSSPANAFVARVNADGNF